MESQFEILAKHLSKWKGMMVKRGLRRAKATCPLCKTKDSCMIYVEYGKISKYGGRPPGAHIRFRCTAGDCSARGME